MITRGHRQTSRFNPLHAWSQRGGVSALGLCFAFVMAFGCGAPTAPDPVSPSTLLTTPTSVVVEGKTLTLGALLWRDFLPPVSSPGGGPMISLLRVQTADGSAVPSTITADTVWLVRGADLWSGAVREERAREFGASGFEVVARDGPKWEVGATVAVIVQLRASGRVVRLRGPDQVVKAAF